MNKSKIEWCDYSWNPVTGCKHGCEYCYAERLANRFAPKEWQCENCMSAPCCDGTVDTDICGGISHYTPYENIHELDCPKRTFYPNKKIEPYPFGFEPTFHRYRLDEPTRKTKGVRIFVCSMADLFGEWVPDEWIEEIMEVVKKSPQHKFMFLTKNPSRYLELAKKGLLPSNENAWFGSTVTTPEDEFWWSDTHNTFVSIEPILSDFQSAGEEAIKKVDWIILGAMTGPGSKNYQPKKEWIENIIKDCRTTNTSIFMKNNLLPYWEGELIQEWPEGL